MTKPHISPWPTDAERRALRAVDRTSVAGVPARGDDVEQTNGLHGVAILFRVMAGMLLLLMILQVANGMTSSVGISYGVLFAEAIRLIIFAGLLWGAGDLADLFVQSHRDLRASRILLGRLTHLMAQAQTPRPRGYEDR